MNDYVWQSISACEICYRKLIKWAGQNEKCCYFGMRTRTKIFTEDFHQEEK